MPLDGNIYKLVYWSKIRYSVQKLNSHEDQNYSPKIAPLEGLADEGHDAGGRHHEVMIKCCHYDASNYIVDYSIPLYKVSILESHHLRACPMRAMRREGCTTVTSCESECASCARLLSLARLPYTSLSAPQAMIT